jgi:hypothetical protein
MEAIRSSETSVNTRSTRRHILEYGILHSHRRENLKSYIKHDDLEFSLLILMMSVKISRLIFNVLDFEFIIDFTCFYVQPSELNGKFNFAIFVIFSLEKFGVTTYPGSYDMFSERQH